VNFFDDDAFRQKYEARIRGMMGKGGNRLLVDVGDLLDFHDDQNRKGTLGAGLTSQPGKYIPLCELALHDMVLERQPDYLKTDYRSRPVHVGFDGPVGEVLTPRMVYARHVNTMVAVEGIITQQSPLRPRVLETAHYCAETNKFSSKEFRDQLTPMLDSAHLPTVNVMPRTDMEGHALRTELGLCSFVDSQCCVLQEAPESAPTGQLPRHLEIRLDDDLVDCMKPGDRVMLVGIYASYSSTDQNKAFKTILLVNHVFHHAAVIKRSTILEQTADEIVRFGRLHSARAKSGVLDVLSRSIAPAIFGLDNEKKAILLQMIGGVERVAHHSHIRGDINVLLVGEPSTAKSQLLRYVLGVVPLAISTTGKGSSGVGLTAAVTTDQYTGDRALTAGAMVLADRGVLCIDEFDKMSPQDRVSMHEAMEQQTVTIAKAGIHASLNARCSVLAAANPVYGFYSVKHKVAFNVGLPESLLSRFDLTFIVLDKHSSDHNRRIGRHILRNHMTSTPIAFGEAPRRTVVGNDDDFADQAALDDEALPTDGRNSEGKLIVSASFLRKYIQHAKTFSPMLTAESQTMITQHYVALRSEQSGAGHGDGQPASKDGFFVTARTLESIVRLATAHAKLRLSNVIDEGDVEIAMDLLRASVHAASNAANVRAEDEDSSKRDREEQAEEGGDLMGRTTRGHRTEDAGAASPIAAHVAPVSVTPGGGAAGVVLREHIQAALKALSKGGRASVSLYEVADAVAATLKAPVTTTALKDAVVALAASRPEAYMFESGDAEDTLYLLA
jgi:DNA replication licensing factor MCM3